MRMLDERREVSVSAAANELCYNRKMAHRNLQVLERIGMPLYQEKRGPLSRWRVVDGLRRKLSLTLAWSEMLALTSGSDLLAGLAGTFFTKRPLPHWRRSAPPCSSRWRHEPEPRPTCSSPIAAWRATTASAAIWYAVWP